MFWRLLYPGVSAAERELNQKLLTFFQAIERTRKSAAASTTAPNAGPLSVGTATANSASSSSSGPSASAVTLTFADVYQFCCDERFCGNPLFYELNHQNFEFHEFVYYFFQHLLRAGEKFDGEDQLKFAGNGGASGNGSPASKSAANAAAAGNGALHAPAAAINQSLSPANSHSNSSGATSSVSASSSSSSSSSSSAASASTAAASSDAKSLGRVGLQQFNELLKKWNYSVTDFTEFASTIFDVSHAKEAALKRIWSCMHYQIEEKLHDEDDHEAATVITTANTIDTRSHTAPAATAAAALLLSQLSASVPPPSNIISAPQSGLRKDIIFSLWITSQVQHYEDARNHWLRVSANNAVKEKQKEKAKVPHKGPSQQSMADSPTASGRSTTHDSEEAISAESAPQTSTDSVLSVYSTAASISLSSTSISTAQSSPSTSSAPAPQSVSSASLSNSSQPISPPSASSPPLASLSDPIEEPEYLSIPGDESDEHLIHFISEELQRDFSDVFGSSSHEHNSLSHVHAESLDKSGVSADRDLLKHKAAIFAFDFRSYPHSNPYMESQIQESIFQRMFPPSTRPSTPPFGPAAIAAAANGSFEEFANFFSDWTVREIRVHHEKFVKTVEKRMLRSMKTIQSKHISALQRKPLTLDTADSTASITLSQGDASSGNSKTDALPELTVIQFDDAKSKQVELTFATLRPTVNSTDKLPSPAIPPSSATPSPRLFHSTLSSSAATLHPSLLRGHPLLLPPSSIVDVISRDSFALFSSFQLSSFYLRHAFHAFLFYEALLTAIDERRLETVSQLNERSTDLQTLKQSMAEQTQRRKRLTDKWTRIQQEYHSLVNDLANAQNELMERKERHAKMRAKIDGLLKQERVLNVVVANPAAVSAKQKEQSAQALKSIAGWEKKLRDVRAAIQMYSKELKASKQISDTGELSRTPSSRKQSLSESDSTATSAVTPTAASEAKSLASSPRFVPQSPKLSSGQSSPPVSLSLASATSGTPTIGSVSLSSASSGHSSAALRSVEVKVKMLRSQEKEILQNIEQTKDFLQQSAPEAFMLSYNETERQGLKASIQSELVTQQTDFDDLTHNVNALQAACDQLEETLKTVENNRKNAGEEEALCNELESMQAKRHKYLTRDVEKKEKRLEHLGKKKIDFTMKMRRKSLLFDRMERKHSNEVQAIQNFNAWLTNVLQTHFKISFDTATEARPLTGNAINAQSSSIGSPIPTIKTLTVSRSESEADQWQIVSPPASSDSSMQSRSAPFTLAPTIENPHILRIASLPFISPALSHLLGTFRLPRAVPMSIFVHLYSSMFGRCCQSNGLLSVQVLSDRLALIFDRSVLEYSEILMQNKRTIKQRKDQIEQMREQAKNESLFAAMASRRIVIDLKDVEMVAWIPNFQIEGKEAAHANTNGDANGHASSFVEGVHGPTPMLRLRLRKGVRQRYLFNACTTHPLASSRTALAQAPNLLQSPSFTQSVSAAVTAAYQSSSTFIASSLSSPGNNVTNTPQPIPVATNSASLSLSSTISSASASSASSGNSSSIHPDAVFLNVSVSSGDVPLLYLFYESLRQWMVQLSYEFSTTVRHELLSISQAQKELHNTPPIRSILRGKSTTSGNDGAEQRKRQQELEEEEARRKVLEQRAAERRMDLEYIQTNLKEATSDVVPNPVLVDLISESPARYHLERWSRVYSLTRDGVNFLRFFAACEDRAATFILIKTSDNDVLGGFSATQWQMVAQNREETGGGFYGSGENFVFKIVQNPLDEPLAAHQTSPQAASHTLTSAAAANLSLSSSASAAAAPITASDSFQVCVYRWTRKNDFFQFTTEKGIGMGGGGSFAWELDSHFRQGVSGACDTFDSPPLAATSFHVIDMEVWAAM